jgi:hypothetical protein
MRKSYILCLKYALSLLAVLWLTGCATSTFDNQAPLNEPYRGPFAIRLTKGKHTSPEFEAWQAQLTEEQLLTLKAAVLAAEIFNGTYDHSIKEFNENPALIKPLRDKVNLARRLYRKADSWSLTNMPLPPQQPNFTDAKDWIVWVPGLPVRIQYMNNGDSSEKGFYGLKVVTLRNRLVMMWKQDSMPTWNDPFNTYVLGDSVNLDIGDLILHLPIHRE